MITSKQMRVTFRKELDLTVDMHRLMIRCFDYIETYSDLESLVETSLEFLYDVDITSRNSIDINDTASNNNPYPFMFILLL